MFNICNALLQLNAQPQTLRTHKQRHHCLQTTAQAVESPPRPAHKPAKDERARTDVLYDAVIVGGGMGGLTTATQMAAKGAKVVVLEKYDSYAPSAQMVLHVLVDGRPLHVALHHLMLSVILLSMHEPPLIFISSVAAKHNPHMSPSKLPALLSHCSCIICRLHHDCFLYFSKQKTQPHYRWLSLVECCV